MIWYWNVYSHVLHYILDIANCKITSLDAVSFSEWNTLFKNIKNSVITRKICEPTLLKNGITMKNIVYHLSRYGSTNYNECFAEAISEYYTSKIPRKLSVEISNCVKDAFNF